MKLTEVGPFQHSKKMQQRMDVSNYVSRNERKDCCARCINMTMRSQNPYCNLHRVHVEKAGVCPALTNQTSSDLYAWAANK